ncbi:hypothetical protein LCGC14_1632940 [marine sediment metagenome]|uniref:Cupin type-2 domain-containing protein n=1 Tax=marine sediment metagenome TaxID=412755 RepID=A0A0F9L1S2_9ZZZZ
MKKTEMKRVEKRWGSELWVCNEPEYCGKLLHLKQDAQCSYHYHPVKKETFYVIQGSICLTIEGKDYMMNPLSQPKTIMPGQKHYFKGITEAVILEVSTHHSDSDVVRLNESRLLA